ncbi:E6 [Tursiops truncatus papillomavirus 2]|uniref:Protein E6 n=1 Tax=Tursiops truncatus papillomavirus 2 TaxID=936060 RepID=Q1XA75_9PAPI|nr:E6 [Tursiops truncatus papillomavirus 2]AAY32853.1 E6 [Tursiops truncatus papillomavirus 2]
MGDRENACMERMEEVDRGDRDEGPVEYLNELCAQLHLPVEEILINCCFCNCQLSERSKWEQIYKDFKLVWREGWPHGICHKCQEIHAVKASWRGYEQSAYACYVEEETGTPLGDIYMRCLYCWIPLTGAEKIHMVEDRRHFIKINGYWKGLCHRCLWNPPRLAAQLGGINVVLPHQENEGDSEADTESIGTEDLSISAGEDLETEL